MSTAAYSVRFRAKLWRYPGKAAGTARRCQRSTRRAALYTGHADGRQVAGYALLTLNAPVELAVAAWLSHGRSGPPLLVAGLILVTSLVLGCAWGFLRFRRPFGGAA
jgi:hypothetical protein